MTFAGWRGRCGPWDDACGRRPGHWLRWVNQGETAAELEGLRQRVRRGTPFGTKRWIGGPVARLELQSTIRPRGRPKKGKKGAVKSSGHLLFASSSTSALGNCPGLGSAPVPVRSPLQRLAAHVLFYRQFHGGVACPMTDPVGRQRACGFNVQSSPRLTVPLHSVASQRFRCGVATGFPGTVAHRRRLAGSPCLSAGDRFGVLQTCDCLWSKVFHNRRDVLETAA